MFRLDSFAFVLDLDGESSALEADANRGGRALTVTMDVGKAFLYDSEDCQFHVSGEPSQRGWDVKAGTNFAAFGESRNIAMECGCEPRLIQKRRMKQMRNRPNLFSDLFNQRRIFRDTFRGLGTEVVRVCLQGSIVDGQGGN